MAIGICDWGIGGLGFYQLLRTERPDLDVVYIGDQGVKGYGLFDPNSLTRRLESVLVRFGQLGVQEVIVACNAASTVVGQVQVDNVRAIGLIEPALDAIAELPVRRIGVIGGRRTIMSGSYSRPLRARGLDVSQRVAQPLSRLIEDGEAENPRTLGILTDILKPLQDVDHIILACTHYVVLEDSVRDRLPNVTIVDPATELWKQFRSTLPPKTDRIGVSRFLTTGSPDAMARQAKTAFGVDAIVERTEL